MKHKFLRKLILATVVTSTLITTLSPVGASAEWVRNYYGNWSYLEGYNYATGWRLINGAWYFFDSAGLMRTGWVQSSGEWYYMDLSGAMQTGVLQIEGKIHLFAPNGAMQKGKCAINKKLYDFDDNGAFIGDEYPTVDKAFDYYGNSTVPYVPNQIVNEDDSLTSEIPSDGSKQVVQYKIKFKDPDADDDDKELLKTRTVDEDTQMALYKPKKSGYTFVEWNTEDDGDGTSYEYNDVIKVTKNLTLYAQWEKKSTTTTEDTTTTKVTSIVLSTTSGSNTIATSGGTLQMAKKVYPTDADTQTVTWSVVNGTGEATISSTGKLRATSNGTVTVRATATDGSGVYGEYQVTISGQS